jgi:ABC-type lipoprotein release transport system permease subunit
LGAVAYRFRAELRARWRTWLGLALLVAVASGTVLTLAAGARRTDSAYGRFLRAHDAYDVLVLGSVIDFGDGWGRVDLDEVASLPQVADSARARIEVLTPLGNHLASPDGRIGTEINRFRVLDGRLADPTAVDEVVVTKAAADAFGIAPGDELEPVPAEWVQLASAFDPSIGEMVEAAGRRLKSELPGGVLTVVGIVAAPGEVPPHFADSRPSVHHTPAFFHRFADDLTDDLLMVRLHGGADAVDGFLAELEARAGERPVRYETQRDHAGGIERSIGLQALALWMLSGLTLVATVLILGQVIARLTYIESGDHLTMAAFGATRRDLATIGMARVAAIGTVGVAMGLLLAVPASALFPLGLARTVEPHQGAAVDLTVLGVGSPVVVVILVALSVWPSWRAANITARGHTSATTATSLPGVARVAAGLPPATSVGVRLALDPGRGAHAVPVRTTVGVVVLGIATLTATLTFGTSLGHLLVSPHLYGVTWDLELSTWAIVDVDATQLAALIDDERVTGLAIGAVSDSPFTGRLELGEHRVDGVVIDTVKGELGPPMLEGRRPQTAGEIALGARTLRTLGVDIGDEVPVRIAGVGTHRLVRVVGAVALPGVSDNAQLGQGALLTPSGLAALVPEEIRDEFRILPGVLLQIDQAHHDPETIEAVTAAFEQVLGFPPLAYERPTPQDIVDFGRIESMPFVLGAIMAGISAATLGHLLRSAVRRRRRELALLAALGFVRRQVRGAVAAQATTVVLIGLVVGMPIGVALGRQAWIWLASHLGIVAEPVVSLPVLALVAASTLLLGAALAAGPARAAARARPATGLRTE